ncbi:MAG: helix-turn-helix transcriptional regulator [Desulfobacterales bacterium]|nr:helix-turn-helix transcriptional regulator [Desulfobacterales bacterium]
MTKTPIPGDTLLRKEILPHKIRERRIEMGLSLYDLSLKILEESDYKFFPQTIGQWERGINCPTTKRFKILAKALEVPESYFYA